MPIDRPQQRPTYQWTKSFSASATSTSTIDHMTWVTPPTKQQLVASETRDTAEQNTSIMEKSQKVGVEYRGTKAILQWRTEIEKGHFSTALPPEQRPITMTLSETWEDFFELDLAAFFAGIGGISEKFGAPTQTQLPQQQQSVQAQPAPAFTFQCWPHQPPPQQLEAGPNPGHHSSIPARPPFGWTDSSQHHDGPPFTVAPQGRPVSEAKRSSQSSHWPQSRIIEIFSDHESSEDVDAADEEQTSALVPRRRRRRQHHNDDVSRRSRAGMAQATAKAGPSAKKMGKSPYLDHTDVTAMRRRIIELERQNKTFQGKTAGRVGKRAGRDRQEDSDW